MPFDHSKIGDRDPSSAGTVGEAVVGDGSSAGWGCRRTRSEPTTVGGYIAGHAGVQLGMPVVFKGVLHWSWLLAISCKVQHARREGLRIKAQSHFVWNKSTSARLNYCRSAWGFLPVVRFYFHLLNGWVWGVVNLIWRHSCISPDQPPR
jgi:hypothetical protein